MRKKRGFTLIELIMFIVIAGICFIPVIVIFGEVIKNNINPETMATATALAESKMENLTGLGYPGTNTTGSFAPPYGSYNYATNRCYVSAADLNSEAACDSVSEYVNYRVTVSHAGISPVVLTTLLTNYTN